MRCLVTGAGGFIGGHLVKWLLDGGHEVRAVDWKPIRKWHQLHQWGVDGLCDFGSLIDLRDFSECLAVCKEMEWVFNLAADMGGMGFIENNKLDCMLSSLISTHMLMAASARGVDRFFFSSSACVYPYRLQHGTINDEAFAGAMGWGLKESEAYPADPEDGYGWEKLFSERMCRHFSEDRGLPTRIARYHNVYGPHGTFEGGREKAPAAICRKVAQAVISGDHEIEIWGDGEQLRTFTYIDDCVEGTMRLMASEVPEPLNIGSSELVTINELVGLVEEIAGVHLKRTYNTSAPQGVRGRNSDNTRIQEVLGWEPSTPLREGMEITNRWIYDQVASAGHL